MQQMEIVDSNRLSFFPKINYHQGFDAFGMTFVDKLGNHGQSDRAQANNRLKRGDLEVLHLHGEEPFYSVGDQAKLSVPRELEWVVEEVADLGVQEHAIGLDTTHENGFVFLVRAIAEEV